MFHAQATLLAIGVGMLHTCAIAPAVAIFNTKLGTQISGSYGKVDISSWQCPWEAMLGILVSPGLP